MALTGVAALLIVTGCSSWDDGGDQPVGEPPVITESVTEAPADPTATPDDEAAPDPSDSDPAESERLGGDPREPLPDIADLQSSTVSVTRDLSIEHPDLVTDTGGAMPATEYDVYVPDGDQARSGQGWPVLIWAHGGAFMAGSKENMESLATYLADSGIAVVTVNYALAPEHQYPTALTQLHGAVEPIVDDVAEEFDVDASRVALGGDSAGMSLMGQLVALQASPDLRAETGLDEPLPDGALAAAVLYCGPTNMDTIAETEFPMMEQIMNAYGGEGWEDDPRADELSLVRWVTADWPATYSSCSLADPLLSQGQELEQALESEGVHVAAVVPDDPTLGHSYQFRYDGVEQRAELGRTIDFLHEQLG